MTVQDLMRHTSGLTYAQFGDTPVQMLWRCANLMAEDQTNEELVGKLAPLPLMSEPGTTWEYSMSTDVLGRVIEAASGQTLADFFAAHIAGPLGMADTAFEAIGERPRGWPSRRLIRRPARGRRCAMSAGRTDGPPGAAVWSRPPPITSGSARCC